jgi:plasmid stabilization system protein ParE
MLSTPVARVYDEAGFVATKDGANTMERHIEETQDASVAAAIREEILDEIADLEEYARQGKQPPHCRGYRIRVNGQRFEVFNPKPTGREILTLAGFTPPEEYTLRVKLTGQKPERVELDEHVDLRRPGVEKFKVLPRDQNEG